MKSLCQAVQFSIKSTLDWLIGKQKVFFTVLEAEKTKVRELVALLPGERHHAGGGF